MTRGNEAKEQVEADRVLSDTSCNPYNTRLYLGLSEKQGKC